MKAYKNRIADRILADKLEAMGAVLIEGPKYCGKTTLASQQAKSILYMADPDTKNQNIAIAQTNIKRLLQGDTPRLIDEWQDAPILWDAIRTAVDQRKLKGQFILTGSTVIKKKNEKDTPEEERRMHTGTGRISTMTMYPMSLYESTESSGEISFLELFDNTDLDIDGITSNLSIEELIMVACRGGWPDSLNVTSDKAKLLIAKDYLNKVCDEDISGIDDVQRNSELTKLILRSYARNLCTLAKKSAMLEDVKSEMETTAQSTFDEYVDALKRLFVIEDIDAWCPAIRSASAIRSGKKRCFIDPSIAVAAMGASPKTLELDLKTFGFVFECMCIRDLKVYSQSMGGKVSYYHDRYGLEADIVLHLDDLRYALIECKLGSRDIDEGAKHLLEIQKLIREKNKTEKQMPLREPDLLIVLTGGEIAYTREDGVKVIPLGCLKD